MSGHFVSALLFFVAAGVALASATGCEHTAPGDPDAAVPLDVYDYRDRTCCALPDRELPDVLDAAEIPDAWIRGDRPDVDPCIDVSNPGLESAAQELTLAPPGEHLGVSRDGTIIAYARSDVSRSVDTEIFLFDLSSWQETRIPVPTGAYPFAPAVRDSTLVWSDQRFDQYTVDFRIELMQHDIQNGTTTRLTDSPGTKTWPLVNDAYILYHFSPEGSNSTELHLMERSTGQVTVLSPLAGASEGHSLGERYAAWVALPAGTPYWNKDVFIYDLQTGTTTRLLSTATGLAYNTWVSGSRVVWMDDRHGDYDVYVYDMATQQETLLTDDPFEQIAPRINGNLVTWIDYRYSRGTNDNWCAFDIVIQDLDTGIRRRVTTASWFWVGLNVEDGLMLAVHTPERYAGEEKLYIFDLVDMGILDAAGEHVLPAP